MSHETFMRRAIELSKQSLSLQGNGPFGAVIVREGVIVGEGVNQVVTTPDPTAHAEVVAIRAAAAALNRFDLSGCTLYTSCAPCPMCLAAAWWARIETIYYGAEPEDAAAVGFDDAAFFEQMRLPAAGRAVPAIGLLRGEAQRVLKAWGEAEERVLY
ncbi:MAG: nucleoside deaminase [Alphaproteobacteria bacterium CG_4_10_14_0_2_um_filter_63_37]|nr:MAG: tRNA-specific adenosine deaminase [Proteobacteria bacterium CG1_02_64_396]PJA25702.1 MAG: nucleoside deaminase [Alphaproteobacteria bacterium CG_4_10_14_0_2_um_filter_63_37]